MLTLHKEKRLLQVVVTLACVVPLSAGFSGVWQGAALLGGESIAMDSHFRYLSGLLLAIGLGFAVSIPHIERHTARIRLLTCIVVIGGLGRFIGVARAGVPGVDMQAALAMELMVTPLICLWQSRIASKADLKAD